MDPSVVAAPAVTESVNVITPGQTPPDNWLADMPAEALGDFPTIQAAPPTTAVEGSPVAPVVPATDENFIYSYKTKADAERGLSHKDQFIETQKSQIDALRNQFIQATGIDPTTNQPVVRVPQAPKSLLDNKDAIFDRFVDAISKGDKAAWVDTLLQVQREQSEKDLSTVRPLLSGYAEQNAIADVSKDIKDFPAFVGSTAFSETLTRSPLLKGAIESARADFNMAPQLKELYTAAYWMHKGFTANSTAQNAVLAAQPPTTTARPTTAPLALAPTPSSSGVEPSMATKAGRDAYIAQFESAGLHNANMDQFSRR